MKVQKKKKEKEKQSREKTITPSLPGNCFLVRSTRSSPPPNWFIHVCARAANVLCCQTLLFSYQRNQQVHIPSVVLVSDFALNKYITSSVQHTFSFLSDYLLGWRCSEGSQLKQTQFITVFRVHFTPFIIFSCGDAAGVREHIGTHSVNDKQHTSITAISWLLPFFPTSLQYVSSAVPRSCVAAREIWWGG